MQRTANTVAIALVVGLICGLLGAALGMSLTRSQYLETLDLSVSTLEKQDVVIEELFARVESQEDELVYLRNNDRCTEHGDEEAVPLGPMDDEAVTGSTGDTLAGATSVAGGVTSNANG